MCPDLIVFRTFFPFVILTATVTTDVPNWGVSKNGHGGDRHDDPAYLRIGRSVLDRVALPLNKGSVSTWGTGNRPGITSTSLSSGQAVSCEVFFATWGWRVTLPVQHRH